MILSCRFVGRSTCWSGIGGWLWLTWTFFVLCWIYYNSSDRYLSTVIYGFCEISVFWGLDYVAVIFWSFYGDLLGFSIVLLSLGGFLVFGHIWFVWIFTIWYFFMWGKVHTISSTDYNILSFCRIFRLIQILKTRFVVNGRYKFCRAVLFIINNFDRGKSRTEKMTHTELSNIIIDLAHNFLITSTFLLLLWIVPAI